MRIGAILFAAAVWFAPDVGACKLKKEVAAPFVPAQVTTPALTVDPAEPPLKVVADGHAPVAVASGPAGATLTVATNGSHSGAANVTFQNASVPMRVQMRLTHLPAHIAFDGLSLNTGTVTLQVRSVAEASATSYYDLLGRPQAHAEQAAYALTVSRAANGELSIQLRRAAGAEVGKSLSISWTSQVQYRRLKCGLGG